VSVGDAENDAFQIVRIAEEIAGVDANLLVAFGKFPGLGACVRGLQAADDVIRREAEGPRAWRCRESRASRGAVRRSPLSRKRRGSG